MHHGSSPCGVNQEVNAFTFMSCVHVLATAVVFVQGFFSVY